MKNKLIIYFPVLFFLIVQTLFAQETTSDIQLNQAGFYPTAPKIAILTKQLPVKIFCLLKDNLKDTVYKGSLSDELHSTNSSTITRVADFSTYTTPGIYVLAIAGVKNSFPFLIADNVHRKLGIASLKGFYFQRVSMPLDEMYAGIWKRPAGHPDTAVQIHPSAASANMPAGTVVSSPGGWYDAGDYNKYIVNSGISMGTLLAGFEDFPAYFKTLNTNIPESGNKVPDILDEALYNLRWMFTMQDPADGGVYNKCTNANFDGMVMPGVTQLPRYLVQKGTAATLDFAAVMAQSARIFAAFKNELPGLSDSCLLAAKQAWKWAVQFPNMAYDQDGNNKKFQPVVNTGGYGDKYFDDEFFWAACELFTTTRDTAFTPIIEKHINTQLSLPSWSNVKMLGYYSLFRATGAIPQALKSGINRSRQEFIKFANALAADKEKNAFKTVMGKTVRDFNWGSNANAANQGIVMINAYFITKDQEYLKDALSNLDYLLGRNATGYCFITGMGSRSLMHPHHRPCIADGIVAPVPGLLAGGPNPGMQDKCAYQFTEPETAYTDVDCSYASNEIAINWNAPLVYLANAIEALQFEPGLHKSKQ